MTVQQTPARIDLATWGDLLKRETMQAINCMALGTIENFYPDTQSADVIINYKRISNGQQQDYPLLVDCPVVVMSGGTGYLTFPIAKGDSCLLFFNDVNADSWIQSGNMGTAPVDARRHSFSDSIALVGLRAFPQALPNFTTDGVKLAFGDAFLRLRTKIKLANNASDLKTVMEGLLTILETFFTALAALPPSTPVVGSALATPATAALTSLSTWQTSELEALLE